MVLRAGYLALAHNLQEAATEISHGDIHRRLSDALGDKMRGTGDYAYLTDIFGDDDSGDAVYSHNGKLKKAGYTMGTANGKPTCDVDCDSAVEVSPRTTYEEQADDEDHYAAMESAKLYRSKTEFPLYERFISKDERKAASSGSFAGKGKSFPILKAADVMAAVRSMGRAGSENYDAGTLKRNIIRIAKEKGFESELPKAWRGDGEKTSEAAAAGAGGLRLVESAATVEQIELREARADYEIKLIAPGAGAMAYYPAEVLKRDGPSAFPVETKVYANHPPKGASVSESTGNRDVYRLAGVLTTPAEYRESHPKGPGLFARVKVFADHGQLFEEKGKYLGMSIVANGHQAVESGKPAVREGLPVLGKLTYGESVDIVPIAGAGGMILTEAARTANPTQEAAEMTAEEATKLIEAAVGAATAPLRDRALRADAREEGTKLLESVALPPAAKTKIIERACASVPVTAEGALDVTKFREAVVLEVKAESEYLATVLPPTGRIFGMGLPGTVAVPKPEEIAAREAQAKREMESDVEIWQGLGLTENAAKHAAKGRAA